MPNSLMDMFQPHSLADNQPIGFGDALAQNRQSLIGLGMGLLQPISLAHGAPAQSPMSNALGGFQHGAQADATNANRQAQLKLHRDQMAQQARLAMMTSDIKEYQYAKGGGYKGSFQDWQKQQQQLQNKASMSPTYYYEKDETGKDVLKVGQLQSGGGIRPLDIRPAETQGRIDTGTGTQLYGTRTGLPPSTLTPNAPGATPVEPSLTNPAPMSQSAPGGFFPKDVRTKAQETELGKDTAKAIQALPAIESNTTRALERLGTLKTHPGLDQATGFIMGKLPAVTPSGRDAVVRINEIQNATWMGAIQDLRGMGALSNREGERADTARSRLLARDVSTEDYRTAIKDLEEVLKTGRDNARAIASGKMKPYSGEQPTTGPKRRRFDTQGNEVF